MKTIDDIQFELRALAQDLELLKKQEQRKTEQLDFAELASMGAKYPITPHPLANCDSHIKKCYLIMLLSIMQYAGEQTGECLLLVYRIAFGMGYLQDGETLKEEYLAAHTVGFEQLNECTMLFQNSDSRLMLVLELLLISGFIEGGKREALEYISRICVLLKLGGVELTFLSNMAAVVLTRDPDQYRCDIRNTYSMFDCYLKEVPFKRKLAYLPVEQIEMEQKYTGRSRITGFSMEVLLPLAQIQITQDKKMKTLCVCKYCDYCLFKHEPARTSTVEIKVKSNCKLILLSAETIDVYKGSETFRIYSEDDMQKWNRVKGQMKGKIRQPIGVETHLLDSENMARAYYDTVKGART